MKKKCKRKHSEDLTQTSSSDSRGLNHYTMYIFSNDRWPLQCLEDSFRTESSILKNIREIGFTKLEIETFVSFIRLTDYNVAHLKEKSKKQPVFLFYSITTTTGQCINDHIEFLYKTFKLYAKDENFPHYFRIAGADQKNITVITNILSDKSIKDDQRVIYKNIILNTLRGDVINTCLDENDNGIGCSVSEDYDIIIQELEGASSSIRMTSIKKKKTTPSSSSSSSISRL